MSFLENLPAVCAQHPQSSSEMLSVDPETTPPPYVLCSGWLCKSPPEQKMKRYLKLFRPKWQSRYFVLQRSEDKYELNYYKAEQSTKKKGSIDLERCSAVIESIHSDFFPNLLALKTWHRNQTRTYYLAASSQAEMKDWVQCVCFVCSIHMPPEETRVIELTPTLDRPSLGQSDVDLRSEGLTEKPRRVSRVFSRAPDGSKAVQKESLPEEKSWQAEEKSGQDGDSPHEREDTSFKSFIQQLSETLSLGTSECDGIEQEPPVQEPPANKSDDVKQRISVCDLNTSQQTQQPPANSHTVSSCFPEDGRDVTSLNCTASPRPEMPTSA